MDNSVLGALEYLKVREMLAARTGSALGRELAESLLPVNDSQIVRLRLDETDEAVRLLSTEASVPLGGARDIRAQLKRVRIGGILEPFEIQLVGSVLYASRRMRTFFASLQKPYLLLNEAAVQITVLRSLESEIENTIAENGDVQDDASPELSRLRREIRQGQHRVREKLENILRSSEYQKYFQETLVTIRGDRYVIPVKQEYRQHFPGIVHDQSSSGATVFIEPMAVVTLNNDLKQAQSAERIEMERILQMLSAKIAQSGDALQTNCDVLAQLDFIFAKSKLALDMKAHCPEINADGWVNLRQARHPLIPAAVVVPIDIHIGKLFSTLLITGPNTGGKTVALKTVGLFALMTQAGLFIPAVEGAEMPVFQGIYADIGDEQSIEQSLSTFSAHMNNLVRILNKVQPGDLVLIDEIGIGTDPDEGATLAMAILEYLHGLGARTIATTHFSELKTFAYTRAGIENASVEFDHQTLRPTYRLLIGVPGSSNAFQISRRLGLSDSVIERARQLLNKEHGEFELVLRALEAEKREYQRRNDEIEKLVQQSNELRRAAAEERELLAARKAEIVNKAKTDAAAVVRQARREADEIIEQLKAQWNTSSEKERNAALSDAKQRLKNAMGDYGQLEDARTTLPQANAATLLPGTKLWVASLQQQGTVIATSGESVLVQLGILKMNVPIADCRLLAEEPAAQKTNRSGAVNFNKVQSASREVDIRGVTVEEGEAILDKFLDDAVMAGLTDVLVIHGKGTGALRKGIRAYLNDHHHVKTIQIAELNEGGDGATAVKLK
jgi:DNA mismatch repair protein MutS2